MQGLVTPAADQPCTDPHMHDALREFSRLWNAGRYFEAHEVLEDRWRRTSDPGERALIQCAAALHHLQRGNTPGAGKLLHAAKTPLRAFAMREPALLPLLRWVSGATEAATPDVAMLRARPPLDLRAAEPGSGGDGAERDPHA